MVQQNTNEAPNKAVARFTHKVCAIRIHNGGVQLSRCTGETWTTVIEARCETGRRNTLVVASQSTTELPVQNRGKMKSLGLSLRHVPSTHRGGTTQSNQVNTPTQLKNPSDLQAYRQAEPQQQPPSPPGDSNDRVRLLRAAAAKVATRVFLPIAFTRALLR